MSRVRSGAAMKADETEIRPCSECLACVKACPTGALKYHDRTWSLDLSVCYACRVCTAICPNHTISGD